MPGPVKHEDSNTLKKLSNVCIRKMIAIQVSCILTSVDAFIAHTYLLRYVHFSFDAIFIEMKQQRLVTLNLSAIEQIKKIKVTTVIALILNYETIEWLMFYYELHHLQYQDLHCLYYLRYNTYTIYNIIRSLTLLTMVILTLLTVQYDISFCL